MHVIYVFLGRGGGCLCWEIGTTFKQKETKTVYADQSLESVNGNTKTKPSE